MKRLATLITVCLLGACSGVIKNTPPVAVYDFGLPATRLVADGAWSRLALEVKSPVWFDSLNIDYRLAYDEPLKQREYVGSRWAGAPGVLLALRLRQQLGATTTAGNSAAECTLRLELQEFSQVFDTPQQSRALLQAHVSLIDGKRQVLAERPVVIEKPAASTDANGGVNALVLASTEPGQQLADWLGRLDKAVLGSCRPTPIK